MADFIGLGYASNDHLCQVAEIPIDHKVEMTAHEIQGGGPAADATVAAARLGLSCLFVTSVGADEAGRRIVRDLASEGIDVGAIRTRANGGSPISYCWIDAEGRRSVVWTRNGLEWLGAEEIPPEAIRAAKILHIDGHHPEAALAAARLARAAGVPVSFDAGTFRPHAETLVGLADILIASEFFARTFTGEDELPRALEKLRQANPAAAVVGITRGARGSLFRTPEGVLEVPAFAVRPVVDTTGAGDAFHGAFAAAWITHGHGDVRACARFASAVAAIKCATLGARAGLPTRRAVESFLRERAEQP